MAGVVIASGAAAAERNWPWTLSGELREADVRLATLTDELARLGDPVVGNTVPQLGFQYPHVMEAPVVSPWVQIDLGAPTALDTVAIVPAQTDFQALTRTAYGFPRRFRVDVSNDRQFAEFTPLAVHVDDDFPTPGVAPFVIPAHGIEARYIRVTVTRLAEANGNYFFAFAEIMALRGARNVALGAQATATKSVFMSERWELRFLTDGRTPLGPPIRQRGRPPYDALFAVERPGTNPWMGVDLGQERTIEEIRLYPAHAWQGADVPGYGFPLQFRVESARAADFQDPEVLFDTGGSDFRNPGNNPVTIPVARRQGRFVRVVSLRSSTPVTLRLGLAEIEVIADGALVSRGCPVLSSGDSARPIPRPTSLLTDGAASLGEIVDLPTWLADWQRRSLLGRARVELEQQIADIEQRLQRRATWGAGLGATALLGGTALLLAASRRTRRRERSAFRARLARDLHDEIGSNLAGIAVLAETASLRHPAQSAEFQRIEQVARETADAMREVLWLVGAKQVDGLDLVKHLKLVAERLLPRTEVEWRELPEPQLLTWPADFRREFFLFFKEAVTNIARHSQATRVELAVQLKDNALDLTLVDNGRGFDPQQPSAGLGLASLRLRAAELGGTLQLVSAGGTGTRIQLLIPNLPR